MTSRTTTKVNIPSVGIGSQHHIQFLDWVPRGVVMDESSLDYFLQDRAYIQASLHADELPGMLVLNHLTKLLDAAAGDGRIMMPITLVPFANPIGLSQVIMGGHLGRFSMNSGINFNRDWVDVNAAVAERVATELTADPLLNAAVIRRALWEEANSLLPNKVDKIMKKELFKRACLACLVLDLHCDSGKHVPFFLPLYVRLTTSSDAVMHMYTHDRLWPAMSDVAEAIGSQCNLLAPQSGGNPFDEALSGPWAVLADAFPSFPIPMACHSATIELRGESEVYDDLALADAKALYVVLVRRGYVRDENALQSILPVAAPLEGTPLTGVDMIEAPTAGVLAWKVRPGDRVVEGQLLGELVRIDDVDAPRIPLVARAAGLVFGMHRHKLAVPGDVIVKVAGSAPLSWRKGDLLTA